MKRGILRKAICFIVMGIVIAALVVGNVFAYIYNQPITSVLVGTGDNFSKDNAELQAVLEKGDELCREMGRESTVLLKNENNALPLDMDNDRERKVNLFGTGAYDSAFMMKGVGSGSSTISPEKQVTLIDALEENGFSYNANLAEVYESFDFSRGSKKENAYALSEPDIEDVRARLDYAKQMSDVAIVVFSRNGGENIGEIPKSVGDTGRTYLEYTPDEQVLLDMVKVNFEKVIVLLNTANTMHAGFLRDEGVDAALYIGLTGQSGAAAVAEILSGKVNPSGRVTDTYVYSPDYDPAYQNVCNAEQYTGNGHLQYSEDIYIGYKWYETADAEGFFDGVENEYGKGYDAVVQYPFGYGLSYTQFSWSLKSISIADGANLAADSQIKIEVDVTNTGKAAGKDVVQLYATPPYEKGGLEKAQVNLVDFAKTDIIQPNGTATVELSCLAYDLASYDTSLSVNGAYGGYVLESGEYFLGIMKNAHDCFEIGNITYRVENDIYFDLGKVQNRFTGGQAYMGVPIDGSNVGVTQQYLSRADFAATFPEETAPAPTDRTKIDETAKKFNDACDTDEMPAHDQDNGLSFSWLRVEVDGEAEDDAERYEYFRPTADQLNGREALADNQKIVFDQELMRELADYDSPEWERLIAQMSLSEMKSLVEYGGFHTEAVQSVGKPRFADYDGPAGFNANSLTGNWSGQTDKETWTAYPSEATIGCSWNEELMYRMGESMGEQARVTSLSGWYAPGVNLHRSAYTARNYEYYSEDGVLSGKLAANVIGGAKSKGLYCYLKHFAVSEMGPNPLKVNTWLTEQNLRENYLRPFEIAVKEGGSNAIMTAFNRVGCIWAGANYALNVQILREEWGFKGMLITDYCSNPSDIGGMSVRQGIRSGNDLWLNASTQGALSVDDPTDMACAARACKNILYAIVDTWNSSPFDPVIKSAVYGWWIPVLITFDVLIVLGFAFWTVMLLRPERCKKKENDDAQS